MHLTLSGLCLFDQANVLRSAMKSLVEHNRPAGEKQSPYTALLVCIAVLGFLVLLASQWRSRQTIRSARVEGNVLLDEKEVLEYAAIALDSVTMAHVRLQDARDRVAKHPFIKNAAVTMQTGETVVVKIEERVPVASILMQDGSVQYVDAEGVILPHRFTNRTLDLPFLAGIAAEPGVDTVLLKQALDIVRALDAADRQLYRNISEIAARNGSFVLQTTDGAIPILFGDASNTDQKVYKLNAYWKAQVFHGDIPDVAYIDLRWDGQVVVSNNRANNVHGQL